MKEYAAPWGKLLVGMSAFSTLVCVGVSVAIALNPAEAGAERITNAAAILPMLVLVVALFFIVRGYVVTADEILVRRLLWNTRFERSKLQSASIEPDALRGSIRIFGNGGLFSFTGVFRSPKLGRYRAFVTDPARTVILRFADRVVVVSPENPEAFALEVSPRR